MYNLKKIYRQKSSFILIFIFIIIFLILIFFFKYLFVVQATIEKNIYDKYRNREIIIYDNSESLIKNLEKIDDILFVYPDYQIFDIKDEKIGTFHLNFLLDIDMPTLIKGTYPKDINEIMLPEYTISNNGKIMLEEYLNKELNFLVNDEIKLNFKIVGIYKVENSSHYACYNLKNINYLLNKFSYSSTDNTRIIINHYKNLNKVLNSINYEAQLYNPSGLDEIQIYETILNLILLLVIIIIIFISIVFVILSNILYKNTKEQRFIEFALGYSNNKISLLYLDYYIKVLLISFALSFLGYIITCKSFELFFKTNNLILNTLFTLNMNYCFLIPISLIILINIIILYIFIYFKVNLHIRHL